MTDNCNVPSSRWRRVRDRWAITGAYLLLGVAVAAGAYLLDRQSYDRCIDQQQNREVLVELVDVATSGDPIDIDQLRSLPQWQALDEADRDFWLVVLSASASSPSTGERIQAFAEDRLNPIAC